MFAAWVQVMARFERSLYADPAQDLVATWWSHVERYQHLRRPDGIGRGDWAAKIHLTVAPVYYHNYLLGQMTASQLEATLERELGARQPRRRSRPPPASCCASGSCAPARACAGTSTSQSATGSPLTTAAFAAELALPRPPRAPTGAAACACCRACSA